MRLNFDGFVVEFDDSQEVKNAVFDRVMEYFVNCESFSSETIMQYDSAIISAPDLMGDIADNVIKFKENWDV